MSDSDITPNRLDPVPYARAVRYDPSATMVDRTMEARLLESATYGTVFLLSGGGGLSSGGGQLLIHRECKGETDVFARDEPPADTLNDVLSQAWIPRGRAFAALLLASGSKRDEAIVAAIRQIGELDHHIARLALDRYDRLRDAIWSQAPVTVSAARLVHVAGVLYAADGPVRDAFVGQLAARSLASWRTPIQEISLARSTPPLDGFGR